MTVCPSVERGAGTTGDQGTQLLSPNHPGVLRSSQMTRFMDYSQVRTDQDRPPGWFVANDLPGDRPGALRSRNVLIAVLLVALIGISFWIFNGRHSGGDPGGSILSSLQSQVKSMLPSDARIVSIHSTDATWASLGCDGSTGWTDPRVVMTFASAQLPITVIDTANHALTTAGWTYQARLTTAEGGSPVWTKTSTESDLISLTNSQLAHLPPGEWIVYGALPPIGQTVQGC